jgi:hypothetical protein
MKLHLFEVDDWAILKDRDTGKVLYEGHGGSDLVGTLLELLKAEQTYLEGDEVWEECESTGTFHKAIERWEKENG